MNDEHQNLIGLQEQVLTKIDDQIFEMAEKYEWKALDNTIRAWVALSGFEKDQSDYQKMKELYQ
jgi:hypothetical protein